MSEPIAEMDVVYICKPGEVNHELRHSLRSLRNLPHRLVWLVGYKPRWACNIEYLPTVQRGHKHANTWHNWAAAAQHPEISDKFILFNDDFYVTRPTDRLPALHRGPLDAMIEWYGQRRATTHRWRAVSTRALLRRLGHADLFSYELHTPLVVDKALLASALAWLEHSHSEPLERVSKRTFYGNYAQIGGEQTRDIKVQLARGGLPETDLPFLSTSPVSWGGLTGGWVRRAFAEPSPYERAAVGRTMYRPTPQEEGMVNARE